MELEKLIRILPSIGSILLGRERLVLIRAASIYQIRTEFIEQVGPERGRRLLARIGFLWGIDDFLTYKHELRLQNPFEIFSAGVDLLSIRGLGKCEVLEVKKSSDPKEVEFVLRLIDGIEGLLVRAREGIQKEPSCVLMASYLSGLASTAFEHSLLAVETQCTASGAPYCEFEIKSAEAWKGQGIDPERSLEVDIGKELDSLEQDLKQQRQLLNIILDTIEEGVIVENENYEIEFMNKVMKDRFGDFEGRKCYEMMGRTEPCEDPCGVREIIHKKKRRFYYRDTDQYGRHYEVYASELIKPNGQRVVLEVSRDITERLKQEQEAAKRQEEIVRFNRLAVDRELRMIELKKEINQLLERLGEPPKYKIPGEDEIEV